MSQSSAVRVPGARPAARSAPPPRLRVISAPPHARSRAGLAIACLVILAAGLVGLLLLNVSLERGSYELHDLQATQDQLLEQRQALAEQIESFRAPQRLAERATALGMVPAPDTTFVRLGAGSAQAAPIPTAPHPTAKAAKSTASRTPGAAPRKAIQKSPKVAVGKPKVGKKP